MTDHEALQIIMRTTELRMSAPYQAAEAMRQGSSAESMARANHHSPQHGAIRLLIGSWERIAMFVADLNEGQRRRFFRCHPVLMAWTSLSPAVHAIRESGQVGPRFAIEFEALAQQYQDWMGTNDGQEYRTGAQQAVCALFF